MTAETDNRGDPAPLANELRFGPRPVISRQRELRTTTDPGSITRMSVRTSIVAVLFVALVPLGEPVAMAKTTVRKQPAKVAKKYVFPAQNEMARITPDGECDRFTVRRQATFQPGERAVSQTQVSENYDESSDTSTVQFFRRNAAGKNVFFTHPGSFPTFSMDFTQVLFGWGKSYNAVNPSIWLARPDGSNAVVVACGHNPSFSLDGTSIFYEVRTVIERIYPTRLVRLDAGAETAVTVVELADKSLVNYRISPDSKSLLFLTSDYRRQINQYWTVSVNGGPPQLRAELSANASGLNPYWTLDGQSIVDNSWATHGHLSQIFLDGRVKEISADSRPEAFWPYPTSAS
jgi:hypothetical protein